jgi:hypothetical protein
MNISEQIIPALLGIISIITAIVCIISHPPENQILYRKYMTYGFLGMGIAFFLIEIRYILFLHNYQIITLWLIIDIIGIWAVVMLIKGLIIDRTARKQARKNK